MLWNPFGDAHNQWDFSGDGIFAGSGSNGWWDKDTGGSGTGLSDSLFNCGVNWQVQVSGAGFLWVSTPNNLGTVVDGLCGVEGTLFPSETLEDDLGVSIDLEVWDGISVASGNGSRREVSSSHGFE